MTETANEQAADRLLVVWAGDVARIKAFLDDHGAHYDLTTRGHGSTWKVTIHQQVPGRVQKTVARIGDVLVFHGALLEVDKREPRRRVPPPEPPASLYDVLAEIEAGA